MSAQNPITHALQLTKEGAPTRAFPCSPSGTVLDPMDRFDARELLRQGYRSEVLTLDPAEA